MGISIKWIEYSLPERVETNADLALENPDWEMDNIQAKSGVIERHIAGDQETALDLSIRACEKIFAHADLSPATIDGIVFCTQTPDYIMPSNAFLVHKQFSFSSRVFAFDYNLACSGYIYGLAIVRGLLATGLAKNVLLINADTYSKLINKKDRSTRVLFGDAAAASIITSDESASDIVDISLSTSGKDFNSFYVPGGGCRLPQNNMVNPANEDSNKANLTPHDIHMNGFAVWRFIATTVPTSILSLLEKNNLSVDTIDLFLFHQASKMTLESLVKELKIPERKVFSNLSHIGNTVSASIPILLKDAIEQSRVKRGDIILLSGFGVGLSWGSVIMRF
jgi:3-oxoacyl-[acyl-carrier-protein] synthase-3